MPEDIVNHLKAAAIGLLKTDHPLFDRFDADAPVLDQSLFLNGADVIENFALLQLFQGRAMKLLQPDRFHAESFDRILGMLAESGEAKILRPAVRSIGTFAQLRCHVDFARTLQEKAFDQRFAPAVTINVRRIQEINAGVDRFMKYFQSIGVTDIPHSVPPNCQVPSDTSEIEAPVRPNFLYCIFPPLASAVR